MSVKKNCTYDPSKPIDADCFCLDRDEYVDNKEKYKLTDDSIKRYDRYCELKQTDYSKDTYCQSMSKPEVFDPSTFDITCYCKYPDAYKNSYFNFSQSQLDNMDSQCEQIRAGVVAASQNPGMLSRLETGTGNAIKNIGMMIGYMFGTKEGAEEMLKFLGIVEGGKIAMRTAVNSARLFISKMVQGEVINKIAAQTAERTLGTAGSVMFEENFAEGLWSSALGFALEESYSVTSVATVAAAGAFEVLGAGLNIAFAVYDVVMLTGMLLDTLDPYGFNNQLSAEDLLKISQQFNSIFMQVVLAHLRLPEGQNWPAEYTADSLVVNTSLGDEYDTNFNSIQATYGIQYLNSLVVNSRGEFIYRDQSKLVTKDNYNQVITKANLPKNFASLNNTLLYMYGDDNLVVSKFIGDNWLLILIVVIVIVVIIFMLKE